jgi:hypothetical protein
MPVRPAAGTTTLAKVQVWLHMIGAILFPAGVAVVLLKGDSSIAAPRRVGRYRRQRLALSLFELIHGIVRETDSRRSRVRATHEETCPNH